MSFMADGSKNHSRNVESTFSLWCMCVFVCVCVCVCVCVFVCVCVCTAVWRAGLGSCVINVMSSVDAVSHSSFKSTNQIAQKFRVNQSDCTETFESTNQIAQKI